MTSKRQVTFPLRVCEELEVKAGDMLFLEEKKIQGQRSLVIRRQKRSKSSWYASLQPYAVNKSHDMDAIKSSVGRALGA